ncbi:MAG: putative Ig domain-containing protein, partial [Ignavibacteriales bacterium]
PPPTPQPPAPSVPPFELPKEAQGQGSSVSPSFIDTSTVQPNFDTGVYQPMTLPGSDGNVVLFRGVPDQNFDGPGLVRFFVPPDAFARTGSDQAVELSATLMDGKPLPDWLVFNSKTGVFEGVPPKNTEGELVIKVVCKDKNGHEATALFKVKIHAGSAVKPDDHAALAKPQRFAKLKGHAGHPMTLAEARVVSDLRARAARLAARL